MKRFKLVFVAALGIMGYVGAAASAGVNQTGTLYHRISANNYEELDPEEQGTGSGQWQCAANELETCLYEKTTAAPISDANAEAVSSGDFVRNQ
ncbi:hypothetical protein JHJ32_07490 [Parapedobacter sp. ISTM3]|uniref:hypothetical protein n=1 Tax=Parapedobacter sp. ISTM3 TaxID=2800130 RepID=UPI00190382BB|nr:hypothetical protein [Parapedobacter sp. ISTM3]MBK1439821.1 hypothetical protein [Parapedobacter sp. ISTM3]